MEKEEAVKGDDAGEKTARPKMIGFVGTNRWSDNHQDEKAMEVGYCFNVDYWGKGYATESFAAFLNWLWAQPRTLLLISRILLDHLLKNYVKTN